VENENGKIPKVNRPSYYKPSLTWAFSLFKLPQYPPYQSDKEKDHNDDAVLLAG